MPAASLGSLASLGLLSPLLCIKLENTDQAQGIGCKSFGEIPLNDKLHQAMEQGFNHLLSSIPHSYPDVTPASLLFVSPLHGCDIMFLMAAFGGILLVAEQESASN